MKITRTIVETVCDYCEGKFEVRLCNVCGNEVCGNHYMYLKEHNFPDRRCNSFIICYKCISLPIMERYVEIKRLNTGILEWGKEWFDPLGT